MVVLFGDHLGHQIDYSIGLSSANIGRGLPLPTELSPVLEECFLIIFLSWRSNFIFLLIPLQFPDSLNVLRGEMSFRLARSFFTAGHCSAGSRLPPLPSALMKIFPFIESPGVRGCWIFFSF